MEFVPVVITVVMILFIGRMLFDLRLLNQRSKHHSVMLDGYYGYQKARLFDMVEHDPMMPDKYDELDAVKPILEKGFFMSRKHITNQELYGRVSGYAVQFGGVDFKKVSRDYYQHWMGKVSHTSQQPS